MKKSKESLEGLWRDNKSKMQATAWKWVAQYGLPDGYTMDDLAQEAYLSFAKSVSDYDPVTYPDVPVGAWICLCYRHHLDGLKRSSDLLPRAVSLDAPLGDDVQSTLHDTTPDVDAEYEDQVIKDLLMTGYMEQIRSIMAEMPLDMRTVLECHYLEGTPLSQIKIPRAASLRQQGLRILRRTLLARGAANRDGGVQL